MKPEEKPKFYPPGFLELWPLVMTFGVLGLNYSKHWYLQTLTMIAISYCITLRICRLCKPRTTPSVSPVTDNPQEDAFYEKVEKKL